jgi:hypothetical protein
MPTPRKHPSGALRQRAYRARRETARIAAIRAKNMPAAAAIPTMPSSARWKALALHARASLGAVRQEMEEYQNERSEAWHESEAAEAFQERVDQVAAALEAVEAID